MLAFCAAFVWWLTEWSPGKPEWAGGGAISSIGYRGVSFTGVYFLSVCRTRVMDTFFFTVLWPFLPVLSVALFSILGFSAVIIARLRETFTCFEHGVVSEMLLVDKNSTQAKKTPTGLQHNLEILQRYSI